MTTTTLGRGARKAGSGDESRRIGLMAPAGIAGELGRARPLLRFLMLASLLALILAAVSYLRAFAPVNGWAYDTVSAYASIVNRGEPEALLIEIEPGLLGRKDQAYWIALIDELERLGVKGIAFSTIPAQAGAEFFARVAQSERVVLGRRVQVGGVDGKIALEPVSEQAPASRLAVSAIAEAEGGVHRMQQLRFQAPGDPKGKSLESRIVELGGDATAVSDPYRVNFLRGGSYIPRLSSDIQELRGMIPEAVRGRVVVVGSAAPGVNQGIATPLHQRIGAMSLAAFQAYSVDTLLRDAPIAELPLWLKFALYLTILIVGLAAYGLVDFSLAARATAVALLAYAGITIAALWMLRLWLPLSEMMAAQLLALLAVFSRRRFSQDLALRDLYVHMAARVRQRLAPAAFYREAEPWEEVGHLVELALEVKSFALLGQQDRSLYLLATGDCDAEDVESRSDQIFAALEQANAAGGTSVESKVGLIGASIAEGTHHYLVPLYYGGEPQGAWVLVVDAETMEQTLHFEDTVTVLAEQIAELIVHRRRRSDFVQGRADNLSRLYDEDQRGEVASHLSQIFGLMERRLVLLEAVNTTMDSALVVYDLFGRVIETNPAIEHWAKLAGIRLYDMTALQFADLLIGRDDGGAREHLRSVIVDGRAVRLLVPRPGDPESLFDVYIRPLTGGGRVGGGAWQYDVQGIVFELHGVGRLVERYRRREEFMSHLAQQLGDSAIRMARGEDGGSADGFSASDELIDAATKLRGIIEEDVLVSASASFPVDPRAGLLHAIKDLRELLDKSELKVELRFPTQYLLVIANPDTLREIYEGLLRVLIEDSAKGTTIVASLVQNKEETGDWTEIEFRSTGFGLPPERLKAYIAAPSHREQSVLSKLYLHADALNQWGGRLLGDSVLGEGLSLTMRMKSFVLEPDAPADTPLASD